MSIDEKTMVGSSFSLLGSVAERRAAVLRAQEERALVRRRALDSQAAADTAPHERIRIWEQLHGLTLPCTASHPLLAVVAAHTNLTLRDITEEQHRRRGL